MSTKRKWKTRLGAGILALGLSISAVGGTAYGEDAKEPTKKEQEDKAKEELRKKALEKIKPDEPTGQVSTTEELDFQMEAQQQREPESNSYANWPKGPKVWADSAVLMDMETGAILYAKQIDKKQYPASITKVMTALVALEKGNVVKDRVDFSNEAIGILEPGDAHIGMKPGEEISLEDAMYGMMLASANEVSYAIAESLGHKIGKGYQDFIDEMNHTAKKIGCLHSHFMNPNGLHNDNHYVSARDMALIGSKAYAYPEFKKIIMTHQHKIGPTNMEQEERVFQQKHKMTYENDEYYYQWSTSGKTGYTDQARTTLISFAEREGMSLCCVVLRTRGGVAYTDTKALFEYGFNHFTHQKGFRKGVKEVTVPREVSLNSLREKTHSIEGEKEVIHQAFLGKALVGQEITTQKGKQKADAAVTNQKKSPLSVPSKSKSKKETVLKKEGTPFTAQFILWVKNHSLGFKVGIPILLVLFLFRRVHLWIERERGKKRRGRKVQTSKSNSRVKRSPKKRNISEKNRRIPQ